MRPGKEVEMRDVISELGIFGYVLGDGKNVMENRQVKKTQPKMLVSVKVHTSVGDGTPPNQMLVPLY